MPLTSEEGVFVDHRGHRLFGPTNLDAVLESADALPDGTRIAVSYPNGAIIAVQDSTGRIVVRAVNDLTEHGGSSLGTGRWYSVEDARQFFWRPA